MLPPQVGWGSKAAFCALLGLVLVLKGLTKLVDSVRDIVSEYGGSKVVLDVRLEDNRVDPTYKPLG
jgi:hypothetical protein